jgi:hypothetical protein
LAKPELAALNDPDIPIKDYTLVNTQPNMASGFAGFAIQTTSDDIISA